MKKRLEIFYDGDCPFCSNYVRYHQLQKDFDVKLIDIRNNRGLAEKFLKDGMNVDTGMIVKIDNTFYFGHEAFWFLNSYGDDEHLVSKINKTLFSKKKVVSLVYPALVFGRNLVLKLLGRKKFFTTEIKKGDRP